MKTIFRMLIIGTMLALFFYYTNTEDGTNQLLEGPNQVIPPVAIATVDVSEGVTLPRPDKGLSTLIGKNSDFVTAEFGDPQSVERTPFHDEWWIYKDKAHYLMIGVANNRVTQVYTNTNVYDVSPYEVGYSLDDIYRKTILEQEVTVTIEENTYLFMMNEDDLQARLLVKYDDLYVQLYMDTATKTLVGIRFLDAETLVIHQPYEFQYDGQLVEVDPLPSHLQQQVNTASAEQIFHLVNSFRLQYEQQALIQELALTNLAHLHSEGLFNETNDPSYGKLEQRLLDEQIEVERYAENVATNYVDSIEVVHGWLNSQEHRQQMLDERYTHTGVGVVTNYYTQIFTSKVAEP